MLQPGNPFPIQVIKPMMKEFSGTLCNFYIVALTVLLPLYTRGTYVMLGDDKYALFYNISLLCLGLGAVTMLAGWLTKTVEMLQTVGGKGWPRRKTLSGKRGIRAVMSGLSFSPTDICVFFYGLVAVVSALFSSYGAAAWTGYQDWHMGAISQLLFVCIYFFVSRRYQGSPWPVYLWETAFFMVIVLGFCSRLGYDPLRLLEEFNSGDWEYSHLISTIGNINWFCGYCAVALAMPVTGYLKGNNTTKCRILFFVNVLGLLLLIVNGSDTGPVLAAVCLGICLLWSRRNAERFRRTLLLISGVALGLPCYGGLVKILGEAAVKAQPADGPGLSVFEWGGWWLVGIVCIGLYILIGRLADAKGVGRHGIANVDEKKNTSRRIIDDKARKKITGVTKQEAMVNSLWLGMMLLALLAALAGSVWYLSGLSGSAAWISGRGALWQLSWQGFLRGDWKQKLLGAGPDCFAQYIYSTFTPAELPTVEGYWAQATFANAHNQWLNHLVNTGLLGLTCVLAIFSAALKRYRGYLPGILALAMYGANSLVSFQQVLSTPLFFLMLGICEYTVRQEKCEWRKAYKN